MVAQSVHHRPLDALRCRLRILLCGRKPVLRKVGAVHEARSTKRWGHEHMEVSHVCMHVVVRVFKKKVIQQGMCGPERTHTCTPSPPAG